MIVKPAYFLSDNTAGANSEVLEAIAKANDGPAPSYGADDWTQRLNNAFSEFFETKVLTFPVATGTAANALALASVVERPGAIVAHEVAHIVVAEQGAPEFFSRGTTTRTVAGLGAKISCDSLRKVLEGTVLARSALSLSQATELGTVYTPSEIAALSERAHKHGLKVHMDGARLANAVAFLDCQPADLTWRAGVDVLSFGATKNGALMAEAVIFFDERVADGFETRRARAGHTLSKMRYISAQLLACIRTGIWRRNAERSNKLAQLIGRSAGTFLQHPVESNQIFLKLDAAKRAVLREQGFSFCDWSDGGPDETRFVVSWNQPQEDVDRLCASLEALREQAAPERRLK